jgi:LuxR family quorum-sensing transcriptional regulator LasR
MVEISQLMSLVNSNSEAAWSEALFDVAQSLGFDSVMVAAVPSKHAGVDSSFVHSNYSLEWRSHYLSARLYEVDPTVTHCRQSVLPLVWQPETFTQNRQIELYEEASGFGIRAGVTFPMHGFNGETGLISFATDARPGNQFTERLTHYMADLSLVRDYAFASALPLLHGRTAAEPVPHLTKRELEVMKWMMAGKSSWEISRITDCAEATVNFHISNIRQKFNVNTRQQALVKAISLGIVTPEDPHR